MGHPTSQGLAQEQGALSVLATSHLQDLEKRGVTSVADVLKALWQLSYVRLSARNYFHSRVPSAKPTLGAFVKPHEQGYDIIIHESAIVYRPPIHHFNSSVSATFVCRLLCLLSHVCRGVCLSNIPHCI